MKLRLGFVSNSSSSSFISYWDSSFDIAKDMIPERDWGERDEELVAKIDSLRDIVDCDNLKFSSCNYDTYIIKENDKYRIETSNNHSFYDCESLDRLREEEYYCLDGIEFFDLENEIYYTESTERELEKEEEFEAYCKRHVCSNVHITRGEFKGTIQCPCCLGERIKHPSIVVGKYINKEIKEMLKLLDEKSLSENKIEEHLNNIRERMMKEI
jgi:hypothetical protein